MFFLQWLAFIGAQGGSTLGPPLLVKQGVQVHTICPATALHQVLHHQFKPQPSSFPILPKNVMNGFWYLLSSLEKRSPAFMYLLSKTGFLGLLLQFILFPSSLTLSYFTLFPKTTARVKRVTCTVLNLRENKTLFLHSLGKKKNYFILFVT